MAGGLIYTKTIEPQYQDGIDKTLILQPNYAYQVPFSFGDDWEDIAIAVFFSSTFSVTDSNTSYDPSGFSETVESSGGTTADTNFWFGAIHDTGTPYLPNPNGIDEPDHVFLGLRGYDVSADTRDEYHNGWTYNGNENCRFCSIHEYANNQNTYSAREYLKSVAAHVDQTTEYMGVCILRIKLQGVGTSGQAVTFGIWSNYNISDPSLVNLQNYINNNTPNAFISAKSLNNGSLFTPIPDSFFFYSPFLTLRPRLHALAVKRLT